MHSQIDDIDDNDDDNDADADDVSAMWCDVMVMMI